MAHPVIHQKSNRCVFNTRNERRILFFRTIRFCFSRGYSVDCVWILSLKKRESTSRKKKEKRKKEERRDTKIVFLSYFLFLISSFPSPLCRSISVRGATFIRFPYQSFTPEISSEYRSFGCDSISKNVKISVFLS